MSLRKLPLGQLVNAAQYNELVDAIKVVGNLTVRGKGVRSSVGPHGTKITIDQVAGAPGGAANQIFRARAQENGQSDGELSVKIVDADKNNIGAAFDVWAFAGETATNMALYLPNIVNNDIIYIKKIDGKWFIDWTPILSGTKTDTISATGNTIFSRIIQELGIW